MSARTVPEALRGIIRFRNQRVFHCFYECNECTDLGSEWMDEMLTVSHSWCPCCGLKAEPYFVEEFEEERPEFVDEEDDE